MPYNIKPPFVQPPFKPAASRGLGDVGPAPVPFPEFALFGGVKATQGPRWAVGRFTYQIPASYVAGADLTLSLDTFWLRANAASVIGGMIVTANGGPIAEAPTVALSGGVFALAPDQDIVFYARQQFNPAGHPILDFKLANLFNLAQTAHPAEEFATLDIALSGTNLDSGVQAATNYATCGGVGTAAAGQNINGGVHLFSGAEMVALGTCAIINTPDLLAEAWTPVLNRPAGDPAVYSAIQSLTIGENAAGIWANGSGAAGVPGFPGLGGIPAGSRTLNPGDRVTVVFWAYSEGAGQFLQVSGIRMSDGVTETTIALTDVYRADLWDTTTNAPQKVGFADLQGIFYRDFSVQYLATEDGQNIQAEDGQNLLVEGV